MLLKASRKTRPREFDVVRFVSRATSDGSSGGPFSTAASQVAFSVRNGVRSVLVAGASAGDLEMLRQGFPMAIFFKAKFVGLRHASLFTSVGLIIGSLRLIRKSALVHVSIAREVSPVAVSVIAILLKRPLVLQPHGMLTVGKSEQRFLIWLIDRVFLDFIIKRASCLIVLTRVEKEQLEANFGGRLGAVLEVGNGVDIRSARKIVDSEAVDDDEVLFLARLHPRKNVSDFVISAALARQRVPMAKFVVVGPDDGDMTVVSAGVSDGHVSYDGHVVPDGVYARVARCSVFVLTASREPWGNVLVAACAMSKPVVVPRSSAVAGVIQEYGAGLIYDDGNVDELAECLVTLISSAQAYELCVSGASRMAEMCLDQDVLYRRLVNLYERLLPTS